MVLWTNEESGGAAAAPIATRTRRSSPKTNSRWSRTTACSRPRGIRLAGPDSRLAVLKELIAPLARIGVTDAVMGEPEADVTPLVEAGVPALALDVDGSRYFWYHHTDADMMNVIDPRQVAECVATMGVVVLGAANR